MLIITSLPSLSFPPLLCFTDSILLPSFSLSLPSFSYRNPTQSTPIWSPSLNIKKKMIDTRTWETSSLLTSSSLPTRSPLAWSVSLVRVTVAFLFCNISWLCLFTVNSVSKVLQLLHTCVITNILIMEQI